VRDPDAGVDHVRPHARAGRAVAVLRVQRQRTLVGAVDAPGGVGLDVVRSRLDGRDRKITEVELQVCLDEPDPVDGADRGER
jgi:hypothetical protein